LERFRKGDGITLFSQIQAFGTEKLSPQQKGRLKALRQDFWRKMMAFAIKEGASAEATQILEGEMKTDFSQWG